MSALCAWVAALALAQAGSPCEDPTATAARWQASVAAGADPHQVVTREVPLLAPALLLRADGATAPLERLRQAAARLPAACRLAASTPAATEADGPRPALLAEILDRPEFEHARRRQSDVLETLFRRFKEWMEQLFGNRGTETFASLTRALVLALALAALLAGALRVLTLRRARRGPTSAAPDGAPALELALPAVHLARARAALSTDGREAIREALLALLSALERRRWARPDRVKTNRELAAELPGRGAPDDVTSDVERIARWYDGTFYSMEPVAADEARRFLDEVARLEGRLQAGGA
jgi:hypothetical protein